MATLTATRANGKPTVGTYRVLRGRNQWRTATKVTFGDAWVVRLPRLVRDPAEAIRLATAERKALGMPDLKPARPFGQGLLRSLPTYRAPVGFDDQQWWAEQQATAEDRRLDERYDDVRAEELVAAGHVI
jgi:hypothetical protein